GDPAQPGLEETIGAMARYFEPGATLPDDRRAPAEFLPWLAGWVALTLREDWDELRQRDLIAQAASLYRQRGTKRGVEAFLTIYTRLGVEVDELGTPMQIGTHSSIGVDTLLGGGAPFYFSVRLLLPTPDPAQIKAQREVAAAIVDLQKPAHTFYTLTVDTPTMQIGTHSKIGVDTLLG
ncbi:MAG TPA: phage tail protein, partial [Burkholderiaceae bacterium]